MCETISCGSLNQLLVLIPSLVPNRLLVYWFYLLDPCPLFASELSDNDKAEIMQTNVLNSQYDIIGFTLDEVESMMCENCVD